MWKIIKKKNLSSTHSWVLTVVQGQSLVPPESILSLRWNPGEVPKENKLFCI